LLLVGGNKFFSKKAAIESSTVLSERFAYALIRSITKRFKLSDRKNRKRIGFRIRNIGIVQLLKF